MAYLIVKALIGDFNKENSLVVGAFSGHCETLRRLVDSSTDYFSFNFVQL